MLRGLLIPPSLCTGLLAHGNRVKAPPFLARFRIKREHEASDAPVAARRPDEHEPLPGDGCGTEELATRGVACLHDPELMARRSVKGENAAIAGAPKDAPVQVGEP